MKCWGMAALLLSLGLAGPLTAADLGPGTVVGMVVNSTGPFHRKLVVQAGDQKWTLHANRRAPVVHAGELISLHEITAGSYVRARGKRIGRQRLEVERIDVAGDRLAFERAQAYRPEYPEGYFVARH